MRVKLVSNLGGDNAADLSRYWVTLSKVLPAAGIEVHWMSLKAWDTGRGGADPKSDLVLVAGHEALRIQKEYAVVALHLDCLMERGLRCQEDAVIQHGRLEMAACARERTLRVAASDWTAHRLRRHGGALADRIIYGPVDVDAFIPSERQRAKKAKPPIIWHAASDTQAGLHLLPGLTAALRGEFELRELRCTAPAMPELLREGDMWLSLDAAAGLPLSVQDALACGLVVVGTDVGVLWSHADDVPIRTGQMLAWLNREIGAVVFDSQQRSYPDAVAEHIRLAWGQRGKLTGGRDYARQHWSLPTFAARWKDAIVLAARRFGLK